jgi:hypothetical protein
MYVAYTLLVTIPSIHTYDDTITQIQNEHIWPYEQNTSSV